MATERSSSTGVKSLRAMFEGVKTENDAHAKTAGAAGIGAADRPLSKVRTAFVEVEPSAKLMRKMRDNVAGDDNGKENDQENVTGKLDDQTVGGARNIGTNGLGQAPHNAAQLLPLVLGNTVAEAAARDEVKKTNLSGPIKSTKPTARTVDRAIPPKFVTSNPKSTHDPSSTLQKPSTRPRTTSKVEKSQVSTNQKNDTPVQGNDTRLATENNAKAKMASAMPSNGRLGTLKVEKTRSAASPGLKAQSKVLSNLSTPPLSKSRSREVLSTRSVAPPAAAITPTAAAATPPTSHPARPKAAGVRSATGFFKPRPKSPTRPIQLPAHLVAQTASSAAKFGVTVPPPPPPPPQQQQQPQQHRPPQSAPVSRRASNISLSARPLLATTAATYAPVSRKTSTFGPPPKPKSGPPGGSAAPAGGAGGGVRPPDDFLARMMRPTTSSASKVHARVDARQSPHARPRVARKVPSCLSINESASAPSASASDANTTLSSSLSPLRAVREDRGPAAGPDDEPDLPLAAATPLLAGNDDIPSSPPLGAVPNSLDAVVENLQD
jgi:hypothetical protein